MIRKSTIWGSLSLMAALGAAGQVQAADCVLPANKLVIAGSTAIQPLIQGMAAQLAAQADIDVFYSNRGSCTGTNEYVSGTDLGGKAATHFGAGGVADPDCTLPVGTLADVGVSDVFYNVCNPTPVAGYTDFQGPAQAMTFVVPKLSSQKALVAEEGYFVFGFGGAAGKIVTPWADLTKFAIRNMGSGTQQMTARALNVPPESMKGTDAGGSKGVVSALTAANAAVATAEPSIGILGAADYDAGVNRTNLQVLAFQGFKQKHAYWPDSSATAFDKSSVRNGHYVIWGPSHIIAKTDVAGKPENQKVADLIDYIQLKKPLGTAKVLDITINAHVVPLCAMRVQRTSEMGDMSPYTPAPGTACGCYMDELLKAGSSGCTACTADAQCGAAKCSNGYCE